MKTIEVTKNQVMEQMEIDCKTKENLKSSPFVKFEDLGFYVDRISQAKEILKNGHGMFSIFRNEQVKVILK